MMLEPGSPEQLMEERVARLVEAMISLSMLVFDPEQRPLVERQALGISQILLRAQLMLQYFNGEDVEAIRRLIAALDYARTPSGLRIIPNGNVAPALVRQRVS